MKLYCDNCMGENEVNEDQIKKNGYRAECKICGHMIFVDAEEVEAIILRRNPIPDNDILVSKDNIDVTEEMDSVAQSNVTTTVAAKLDISPRDTSPAILTVIEGPDIGMEFDISVPRLIIGRRGADINLNDKLVSRRHLVIEAAGGRYLMKDLGSTNGSFLNGTPVSMEFLKHGDQIQLGSTLLKFRIKNMDTEVIVLD